MKDFAKSQETSQFEIGFNSLKSQTAWGLISKSGIKMIKNSILSKRVFRTRAKLAFFVFF